MIYSFNFFLYLASPLKTLLNEIYIFREPLPDIFYSLIEEQPWALLIGNFFVFKFVLFCFFEEIGW